MLFSFNWLQSFFIQKLPKPEKLAELLTMHFMEVEEIEKKGSDWALDIDILPNRGSDCFSHLGIARECGAILNSKLKTPAFVKTMAGKKDFIPVEVKDKIACPRYTAKVMTDVKVGESPKWIKERLKICGLQPINNIVDAANYVMLDIGQPLHTFDFDKLEGRKIIVRKARKGEKITTLDNIEYNLDKDVLVIVDSKEPLAIAGIKGGRKAEIDQKTRTIVLEAANFEMRTIRKASQKLKLKTDASWRFEHNLDPSLTEMAINRAANLIQEISGGKISEVLIDIYPKKILPKKIKLDLSYAEKLLGVKISKKEIMRIFKNLGFQSSEVEPRKIEVVVPTFRQDISIPEDLIEEIGRLYGYDKISPDFPLTSLIPPKRNEDIFWSEIIKNILKEVGFSEVYNYSFISPQQVSDFLLSTDNLIELKNPISEKHKYLRPSLIPNLLKNIKENKKRFKEIKIFELGKVFEKRGIKEKNMLTGIITGDAFYMVKGVIDLLLNKLGISDVSYIEHSKKGALIKIGQESIGVIDEIFPEKLVYFDIDFEKLKKSCSEEQEYQILSRYPMAVRDIALLVPLKTKVVEALNEINQVGGELVRDVDLFDIYEGENLPNGKKNFAFHIIYQAKDRTLTAKEIDKIHQKIIKSLEQKWQVRK